MAAWDGIIPEADLAIYERAGFSRQPSWEGRPTLLIVDALWGFIGHQPVDVLEAIKEYPTACGQAGWDGMARIAAAIAFFREAGLPVIYVCADGAGKSLYGATTRTRRGEGAADPTAADPSAYGIPEQIAPEAGEAVVMKTKASGFFRTSLDVLLWRNKIDTVLIAGATTCGCVRATTVDAHSLGFETIVLQDAVWDRSPFSHAVSLFELSMKYAAVTTVEEAVAALGQRHPA
ncbi:MAG TPA: isochorismatase family protein [Trebonia sp.]|jgi:nicotinamidase-related amidase